ncbi:hypothetical protein [Deinococcus aquiradiocola]|uniref:Uncharacterized protein n=1 Tax=Deinococcus aquiradiocola TaxID=393059 RepID=A0A917PPL1_9DEIO|nr:hypothetical protein [Deinococcus aquiradiocola]GGJ86981.1 hypothetical protein GCM10008939_33740 [Deinococcus aquiradiocola]
MHHFGATFEAVEVKPLLAQSELSFQPLDELNTASDESAAIGLVAGLLLVAIVCSS